MEKMTEATRVRLERYVRNIVSGKEDEIKEEAEKKTKREIAGKFRECKALLGGRLKKQRGP